MTKKLFAGLSMLTVLCGTVYASEIMPYLERTGLAGADVKVYYLSTSKDNILFKDKLIGGVPVSTFNYTSRGYMAKAAVRPPLLGIEVIGKLGCTDVEFEGVNSTDTYSGPRTGINIGLGIKKTLIPETKYLPEIDLRVDAVYTHNILNTLNTDTAYDGSSLIGDVQGSAILSREISIKVKKLFPKKEKVVPAPPVPPAPPAPPTPPATPEVVKLVLGIIGFASEDISKTEIGLIAGYMDKYITESGIFKVVEKEKMEAAFKEKGYEEKGCSETACAKEIAGALNIKNVLVVALAKTEDGIYAAAISLVNVDEDEPIYVGMTTFNEITNAEAAIKALAGKLVEEKGRELYEKKKQEIADDRKVEEEKETAEEKKLEPENKTEPEKNKEEAKKEIKEEVKKELKEEEKNKTTLVFIPYGGIKACQNWIMMRKNTDADYASIYRKTGVVGVKMSIIPILDLYIEIGFSGETTIATGVGINFGI